MFFNNPNRNFPFNFINGTPASFDTLFEALPYNSSSTHLIVNKFPAAVWCPASICLSGCFIGFKRSVEQGDLVDFALEIELVFTASADEDLRLAVGA